jgi:hypothetical protein
MTSSILIFNHSYLEKALSAEQLTTGIVTYILNKENIQGNTSSSD